MAAPAKKVNTQAKNACKYGAKCYRRNPQHIQAFSHPTEGVSEDPVDPLAAKANSDVKGVKRPKGKGTMMDFFPPSQTKNEDAEVSEEKPPLKKQKLSPKVDEVDSDKEKEDSFSKQSDGEASDQEEDPSSEALEYPEDVKECIKQTFLFDMPDDFYQFWEFCKTCKGADPSSALKRAVGLRLSGPFDILAGRHKGVDRNRHGKRPNFLLHQRFYFDPPEFQTVLVSEEDNLFHIGYFRDDPGEAPVFMASNSPKARSPAREKISQCGDNIFAAVHIYATHKAKSEKGERKKIIEELIQSLEKEAKKLGLSLTATTKGMKQREKKVNCPTFHGAGMVVPVDDNDVGYRPVPETPKALRIMLENIVEGSTEAERDKASDSLQEIITFIQFANDECDYGEGLELGLCLFSFGRKELHPQISLLMPLAYQLLQRDAFQRIIEAHLKCRRRVGHSVDELEV